MLITKKKKDHKWAQSEKSKSLEVFENILIALNTFIYLFLSFIMFEDSQYSCRDGLEWG